MSEQFLTESLLAELRGERFVYVPNPGNAGDSLIACSTYQVFERLGLEYEIGSASGTYPGRVVVYGGGGNLVTPYPNARNFIESNHKVADRLIILPHTIRAYSSLLSKLDDNVVLVCREVPSFEYCASSRTRARVLIDHDMALRLDLAAINVNATFRMTRLMRSAKRSAREVRYVLANRATPRILRCFRSDIESSGLNSGGGANIDVSNAYAADSMSLKDSNLCTLEMIRLLSRYENIETDRLHIAILSALMKKRVAFFDNNYGKNSSVYEYSLKGRFSTIDWCSR